jgi:predicted transcriptional regulator
VIELKAEPVAETIDENVKKIYAAAYTVIGTVQHILSLNYFSLVLVYGLVVELE